jgi:2,3-bisphosphoglycerate-independent phosphoglycerate mutase
MTGRKLLVVFLDGVGIGEAGSGLNPFMAAELPAMRSLFGGLPTLDRPVLRGEGPHPAITFPVDASLGHPGTPQSGTGQTSLLTGRNGADLFGRHFGPWVPTALRELVRESSFLRASVESGRSTAFLNAYPAGWPGPRGGRRVAGPPLAALGAGLLTRGHAELAEGRAVASGIVNDGWIEHLGFEEMPRPSAEEVGGTLARLGAEHDLSLYAHYATDTAGHRGGMEGAIAALERVDAMIAGVLADLDPGLDLLLCSDHGNVEDVRTGHTRNPALGALVGGGVPDFESALPTDLPGVYDFVLRHQRLRPIPPS